MRHYYDGQVRRYLLQVIRLFSNFVVKYGDGTLVRVPVMYGDQDKQVASIISQNTENIAQGVPKIAVYISDLQLDTSRLSDSSFVGKIHVRERAFDQETGQYLPQEGDRYTVERLMPTPYRLSLKIDIWTSNLDQKLQLFEQISVLFNPSLEIQTTDNFVDWTSLTVIDLENLTFSSRTVPVGTSDAIDILTLSLGTPIYISPPAKVKRLGIITKIIANVFGGITGPYGDYIEGLGTDPQASDIGVTDFLYKDITTIGDYDLEIDQNLANLKSPNGSYEAWERLTSQFEGEIQNDLSRLYLEQPGGSYIVGYITINPDSEHSVNVRWDEDSYPSNEQISSPSFRENLGSFDAIIDPFKFNPKTEYNGYVNYPVGLRLLSLENIGGSIKNTIFLENRTQRINTNMLHSKIYDHKIYVNDIEVPSTNARIPDNLENGKYYIILDELAPADSKITYELYANEDGPDAWKNADGSDFVAEENDIIEWDGARWHIVFSARDYKDAYIYVTNTFTSTQYVWNGINWSKSFERVYNKGEWRLEV